MFLIKVLIKKIFPYSYYILKISKSFGFKSVNPTLNANAMSSTQLAGSINAT